MSNAWPGRDPMLQKALDLAQAGRIAAGLEILQGLADKGEPEACYLLGEICWVGGLLAKDPARARRLFEQASAGGYGPAHTYCTNLLASGIAGPRDWPAALRRLHEEAKTDGVRRAMLNLIGQMGLDGAGEPGRLPEGEPLSRSPMVMLFRGAVSAAECASLMHAPTEDYRPAQVADGRGGKIRDPIRTAAERTIHWLIEDPATHALNRRLAALSGSAADCGEPLQILRYRPGDQYRPHVDWDGGENRRIATGLIYLNDDYAGGETHFVQTGLKVKGRTGDVLVFRSADERGELDPMAEHAGLPVTSGVKYLASRWIHERRYDG